MAIKINYMSKQLPLGDRIDFIVYCYLYSLENNVIVSPQNVKDIDFFIKLLSAENNLKQNLHTKENRQVGIAHILNYYKSLDDYPKAKNIPVENIRLPKKFVVSQWDAAQEYRRISEERQKNILAYYKNLGYEIIVAGGLGEEPFKSNLSSIAYAMSKADYYVGADSGMMNLAKIIMPTSSLHVYVNTKWSRPNSKHHYEKKENGLSLSRQVKNVFAKGGKMNYCEKELIV